MFGTINEIIISHKNLASIELTTILFEIITHIIAININIARR